MSVERLTFDSRLLLFIVVLFSISRFSADDGGNTTTHRRREKRNIVWEVDEEDMNSLVAELNTEPSMELVFWESICCTDKIAIQQQKFLDGWYHLNSHPCSPHKRNGYFFLGSRGMWCAHHSVNAMCEERKGQRVMRISSAFYFASVESKRERERVSRLIKLKETIKIRPAQLGSFFFLWVYKMF